MSTEIPFHAKTETLLRAFVRRPHSSLLIIGDTDDGVNDAVEYLINHTLPARDRASVLHVSGEADSIGIESIRDVAQFFTTKQSTTSAVSRICVVNNAQTLTAEAQNTLLKLLEEPINGALIILQATTTEKILSTITSRCQVVPVVPLSKAQAEEIAQSFNIDDATFARICALSEQKRSLFMQLLHDIDAIPEHVQYAKTFLAQSVADRLRSAADYDNKETLQQLIRDLQKIARAGMNTARDEARLQRWQSIAESLVQSSDTIQASCMPKLVFLKLCTSL